MSIRTQPIVTAYHFLSPNARRIGILKTGYVQKWMRLSLAPIPMGAYLIFSIQILDFTESDESGQTRLDLLKYIIILRIIILHYNSLSIML